MKCVKCGVAVVWSVGHYLLVDPEKPSDEQAWCTVNPTGAIFPFHSLTKALEDA